MDKNTSLNTLDLNLNLINDKIKLKLISDCLKLGANSRHKHLEIPYNLYSMLNIYLSKEKHPNKNHILKKIKENFDYYIETSQLTAEKNSHNIQKQFHTIASSYIGNGTQYFYEKIFNDNIDNHVMTIIKSLSDITPIKNDTLVLRCFYINHLDLAKKLVDFGIPNNQSEKGNTALSRSISRYNKKHLLAAIQLSPKEHFTHEFDGRIPLIELIQSKAKPAEVMAFLQHCDSNNIPLNYNCINSNGDTVFSAMNNKELHQYKEILDHIASKGGTPFFKYNSEVSQKPCEAIISYFEAMVITSDLQELKNNNKINNIPSKI